MALDDPEGWRVYREISAEAADDPKIRLLTNLTGVGNVEVNALQRLSDVVVQKSLREGFGLVVSEALWKRTPVVAGRAGGIPLQMADGVGGALVQTVEQCATEIAALLEDPERARELAEQGQRRIREHFLTPRLVLNELCLMSALVEGVPRLASDASDATPRDPVCGMAITDPDAPSVTYHGKRYASARERAKHVSQTNPSGSSPSHSRPFEGAMPARFQYLALTVSAETADARASDARRLSACLEWRDDVLDRLCRAVPRCVGMHDGEVGFGWAVHSFFKSSGHAALLSSIHGRSPCFASTAHAPSRFLVTTLALVGAVAIAPPASATAPSLRAERAFLVDMVGHHAMAVDMAEMAKEKATHQELKDMADDIIRTQTTEIHRMRSWLKRWYGRTVGDEHMGHHEDMQMLEDASGPEFEVRFLAMMSVHHTQAIERARAVRRYPLHTKVRKLTRDITRAQRREIGQMQEWLVAWYAN